MAQLSLGLFLNINIKLLKTAPHSCFFVLSLKTIFFDNNTFILK